jgi:hypothetical protein
VTQDFLALTLDEADRLRERGCSAVVDADSVRFGTGWTHDRLDYYLRLRQTCAQSITLRFLPG